MGNDLTDIQNIAIDSNLNVADKLMRFMAEVQNPYQFTVNGTKVNIVFSRKKNSPDIESALVKIASNRGK